MRLGYRAKVAYAKKPVGNKRAQWCVHLSGGRDPSCVTSRAQVARVPYDGRVYCVEVPEGYIVTERNGTMGFHGNTDASYTVLVLGTFVGNTFRIFYAHRFTGEDVSPEIQLEKIIATVHQFNVRRIGADYGGGQYGNDKLVRTFGRQRIMRYQYASKARKKLEFKPQLQRFIASRTEVMSDIFNAIKRHRIEFPCWEDFGDPYGMDMLNIFSEYNEQRRETQYKHGPDKPDDTFHAVLYCVLAAMLDRPMPDIIAPNREQPGTHFQSGGAYQGPTQQS